MKKICCLAALWMANLTPLSAATVPFAHDLAVYDSLIANLKPGQEIVPFGDVGITPEQLHAFHDRLVRLQAQGPQTSALTPSGTTFKWPGGNVYYRFDPAQVSNGTITALKMQQFRDAVAEWSAFANLHFIEFSGTPPANYVTASENPSLGGGYSNSVGMKGGEQLAQFGSNAWNRGTICHEIGHALGLWHEQQRPDRETYVHVHTENLADPNDGNFTIVPDGQTFGSAYDFYSVMHYSRNALSNTGQDVITMQPGYTQYIDVIGKVYDRTLSKIERATMATIYGNPATLPSAIVTNTADSGSGSLRTAIYYAFDRSPAATTVTFAIPTSDANYDSSAGVFRVRPTYELVAPGNATTIDGSTQVAGANASGPKIVLDGSNFTALKAAPFYYSGHGFLLRAANCTVKGFTITGFSDSGVKIFQGTDPTGGAPTGNVIDSNRISNCGSYGIEMSGATATANIAKANYVGTDQTGNSAQPNAYAGVVLYGGAHGNTIGPGNVISGNTYQGLTIDGAGSSGNIVTGNYIGTKANGTAALPNGSAGLSIYNSATSNLISGNVLSGNFYQGLTISDSGTTGNLVQGNLIGTDKNGAAAIPNQSAGLSIYNGAQANTIGGVVPGTRNVISGNSYQAITIDGAGTNGNFVQGNFIGLDLTGLLSLANNSTDVQISNGAQTNTIGGTQAGARNYICSSPYYGVALIDSTTAGNLVQGNSIGVNLAGVARGNNYQGVVLFSGAHNNLIGGSALGASNLISGNLSDGLAQFTNTTAQNTFSRNSIDGNNYRGIALYDGSNNSQPFPAISSAVLGPTGNISGLDVEGTYSGAAGTLEFFGSPAADSSGFGEGKTYLGSLAISGPGSFTAHLAAAAPAGTVVAVSATDALGNTSEFSQTIAITSTDNGSDGMPDAWMLTYFGHIDPRSNDKSRASDDADGDGLTNLQEFLAGTNPKAANSAFRIATIARSANSVSLTFPSVSGKTYRVEEKDSLTQIAWTLLQDQISATSTTTMIVDPIGSSATQRFYRVVLEP